MQERERERTRDRPIYFYQLQSLKSLRDYISPYVASREISWKSILVSCILHLRSPRKVKFKSRPLSFIGVQTFQNTSKKPGRISSHKTIAVQDMANGAIHPTVKLAYNPHIDFLQKMIYNLHAIVA